MATTFVDYTGDGNATKAFSFPSIQQSDIKVTVDEVLKSSGTHYNITSYTTTGGGNVVFTSGNIPASPAAIRIFRDTSVDAAKATYTAGSSVKAEDLNANHEQLLFAVQEEQNIVSSTQTVKGFISAADKVKLDGIETAATADQTASEIRTLVESATDSNVFTDADHTKLNAIEAGATGDQSNAEIRAAVEAASDSNVFTDADHSKLNGVESGATADQTSTEIKSLLASDKLNADHITDYSIPNSKIVQGSLTGSEHATGFLNNANFITAGGSVGTDKVLVYDASETTNWKWATQTGSGGGGSAITIQDEGSSLSTAAETINFVGSGVTASGTGTTKTITISGGGGGGGGLSNVVEDTTPQLGGNLDVQTNQINTSTTNGNVKLNPNGTGCVEIMGDGSTSGTTGAIQLNCSNNNHGVKIQSPAHSAGATYTLTLPVNNGNNNQVLKTDGNGVLAWVDQTTDTDTVYTHPNHTGEVTSTADGATVIADDIVDEANLKVSNAPTNGYFLSAQSGNTGGLTWAAVDLTALSATNLTSGTIPDARFPATLPAVSGANLTNLPASISDIVEHKATLTANKTIGTGNNALVAGPFSTGSYTLTIPSGSTFTIV